MSGANTGDPWLDLWAAVMRLAIHDAHDGCRAAAAWLWAVDPAVAEIALEDLVEVTDDKQTLVR